jgi:threonine synthase
LFIQVGGGAFAANAATGLFAGGLRPMLHAVQTQGCAPLARAWDRAKATGGTRNAGSRWDECMWPWEGELTSLADGILDDETYDWVAVCNAMSDSGGSPVVASEQHVVEAYALAHRTTDIDVSPTGSAGLAGVLAMRDSIADDERVVVVFSGVRRHFMALPNE